MPVIMGQYTVTTSTVPIFTIPPGAFSCTMYNSNSTVPVYLGTNGARMTTANSLVMHSVPTSFQGYMTTQGATVYGFATTATSINVLMVTDQ